MSLVPRAAASRPFASVNSPPTQPLDLRRDRRPPPPGDERASCPRARPARSAGPAPNAARSTAARSPAAGSSRPVVDDLRDEPAHVGVHAARALEEDAALRRDRRVVAEQVLEHRAARARRDATPCETCASCSGSPSRTTLRAHVPIASASASETWPASSMNR